MRITALLKAVEEYADAEHNYLNYRIRCREISTSDFGSTLEMMSEEACLSLFRFRHSDLHKIVAAVA